MLTRVRVRVRVCVRACMCARVIARALYTIPQAAARNPGRVAAEKVAAMSRAHGNTSEYVPFFAILFLLVHYACDGQPGMLLDIVMVVATVSRVSSAVRPPLWLCVWLCACIVKHAVSSKLTACVLGSTASPTLYQATSRTFPGTTAQWGRMRLG